jgi:hypothetical protein
VTSTVLTALLVVLVAASLLGYRSAAARAERARRLAALRDKPGVVADFTTPEGAILSLEDAFRRRDLEGAVAARDFTTEAALEIASDNTPQPPSDAAIAERATALEAKFRALMTASWPDFSGVESHFLDRQSYSHPVGHPISANIVVVTEVNRFAQGGYSEQRILVVEKANGWRVLNPLS